MAPSSSHLSHYSQTMRRSSTSPSTITTTYLILFLLIELTIAQTVKIPSSSKIDLDGTVSGLLTFHLLSAVPSVRCSQLLSIIFNEVLSRGAHMERAGSKFYDSSKVFLCFACGLLSSFSLFRISPSREMFRISLTSFLVSRRCSISFTAVPPA